MTAATDETLAGKTMTFREHIRELRRRIVRIAAALVVGTILTWEYRHEVFDFMSAPVTKSLAAHGIYSYQAIGITESVMVYMKVTLIACFFLLAPYIFYELWSFISPGLYKREKRFILPLTGFSLIFFLLGAFFAYFVIIPVMTNWMIGLTLEGGNVDVALTLSSTYSFSWFFLLMAGLVFELPLVLFFLALWGVVSGKGLLKFWRYFVVISFLIAGVITPPDPLSQSFLAVPLNFLYGFGVLIAFTVSRARAREAVNVSGRALRALALSLLLLTVVSLGFALLIGAIRAPPLIAWAPTDNAVVVGLNPRVIASDKALTGLIRTSPTAGRALDALQGAGMTWEPITEGLVVITAAGERAVILRGDDAGLRADAVNQALAGAAVVARAADDDVLVIGAPTLADAIVARGPIDLALGDDDERLLERLSTAGAVWVWLGPKSPARAAVVGTENATDLGAVGASLALDQRRRLVFDLPMAHHGAGVSASDRVETRIEAARAVAIARGTDDKTTRLAKAVRDIVGELGPTVSPATRTKLDGIAATIATLAPLEVPDTFPVLVNLAPEIRGVSVRRDRHGLAVTAELDDHGLITLFGWIAGTPPAAP